MTTAAKAEADAIHKVVIETQAEAEAAEKAADALERKINAYKVTSQTPGADVTDESRGGYVTNLRDLKALQGGLQDYDKELVLNAQVQRDSLDPMVENDRLSKELASGVDGATKSMHGMHSQMRMLHAATFELSREIPGLSHAFTMLHYASMSAGGGIDALITTMAPMAALTVAAGALASALKQAHLADQMMSETMARNSEKMTSTMEARLKATTSARLEMEAYGRSIQAILDKEDSITEAMGRIENAHKEGRTAEERVEAGRMELEIERAKLFLMGDEITLENTLEEIRLRYAKQKTERDAAEARASVIEQNDKIARLKDATGKEVQDGVVVPGSDTDNLTRSVSKGTIRL